MQPTRKSTCTISCYQIDINCPSTKKNEKNYKFNQTNAHIVTKKICKYLSLKEKEDKKLITAILSVTTPYKALKFNKFENCDITYYFIIKGNRNIILKKPLTAPTPLIENPKKIILKGEKCSIQPNEKKSKFTGTKIGEKEPMNHIMVSLFNSSSIRKYAQKNELMKIEINYEVISK